MPATTGPAPARVLVSPSTRARLLGLGSVFGKAFRDSRRTAIVLGVLFALVFAVTAAQVAAQFTTVAERLQFAASLQGLPPIFQGMLGEPIEIDKLGGFMSWRILNFLPIMLGIWAVVALSGLLAAELARGSLDLVAASPIGRPRLAFQKLAGYLVALALALGILVLGMAVAFAAFAKLPGDEVGFEALLAQAAWLYLAVLFPGALAFAVAPLVGRNQALGIGAVVLFGSFVINGFASSVSAFEQVRGLSYLALTAEHRPLAGRYDWPSIALLASITVALLGAGIALFSRRDLLVSVGGRVRYPSIGLWLRGPFTRAFGERLPAAIAWGTFLGVFGLFIATSADQFVASLGSIPQVVDMIKQIFPNEDILSTGGFLQLAFFQEAILVITLAAGTFVAGWASDETERRLEVVLGAPVSRAQWALRSAVTVMAAIAVMSVLMAAGVAAGAATQTGDIIGPVVGLSALGLYGMALAGIGLAVGGLVRPSLAAPVTVILGMAFYLLDLIGSILDLPDFVVDLALNRHLGRPILGVYDAPGMALCAGLAIGGVVLCALGMRRRDIGR
jgi:ABC-type transport system involved in multi-copper enzyme maturation permease subunit